MAPAKPALEPSNSEPMMGRDRPPERADLA